MPSVQAPMAGAALTMSHCEQGRRMALIADEPRLRPSAAIFRFPFVFAPARFPVVAVISPIASQFSVLASGSAGRLRNDRDLSLAFFVVLGAVATILPLVLEVKAFEKLEA